MRISAVMMLGALILTGSAAAQQLEGVDGHPENQLVQNDPAKAAAGNYKLDLTQKFQEVSGTATMGGKTLKVENGRLSGENFTFELVDGSNRRIMMGSVSGGSITGKDWSATKG